MNRIEINVHGFTLDEALDYIHNQIDACVDNQIAYLYVNHGWSHGNKIKTKVLQLTSNFHPCILNVREDIINNGVSIITLKTKVF